MATGCHPHHPFQLRKSNIKVVLQSPNLSLILNFETNNLLVFDDNKHLNRSQVQSPFNHQHFVFMYKKFSKLSRIEWPFLSEIEQILDAPNNLAPQPFEYEGFLIFFYFRNFENLHVCVCVCVCGRERGTCYIVFQVEFHFAKKAFFASES